MLKTLIDVEVVLGGAFKVTLLPQLSHLRDQVRARAVVKVVLDVAHFADPVGGPRDESFKSLEVEVLMDGSLLKQTIAEGEPAEAPADLAQVELGEALSVLLPLLVELDERECSTQNCGYQIEQRSEQRVQVEWDLLERLAILVCWCLEERWCKSTDYHGQLNDHDGEISKCRLYQLLLVLELLHLHRVDSKQQLTYSIEAVSYPNVNILQLEDATDEPKGHSND